MIWANGTAEVQRAVVNPAHGMQRPATSANDGEVAARMPNRGTEIGQAASSRCQVVGPSPSSKPKLASRTKLCTALFVPYLNPATAPAESME